MVIVFISLIMVTRVLMLQDNGKKSLNIWYPNMFALCRGPRVRPSSKSLGNRLM